MKTALGMAKINWRNAKTAYIIAGLLFALGGIVQYVIDWLVDNSESTTIAAGNYLYLLPLLMGICVPAQNFSKLMHLGGKRMDFFKSGIITYVPIATAASLLSLLLKLTVDSRIASAGRVAEIIDLCDVFGFMSRGAVMAFVQMTIFLTLVSCVAHTLTLIQGRWYGWLADALIVAIISVFTPIAPLRAALAWFFNMIIFNDYAIVQLVSAGILGAAVYCAGLIPIARKQV